MYRISRVSRLAAVGVGVALALVGGIAPAVADTRPTDPGEPVSVAADALPTVQIDGVVWQQVVVGNTVYVAGSFSNARPPGAAPGTSTVPRSNLLAYDIRTGNLISSWAPTTNAQALTIAASPDGRRIYIGGDFTQVNGASVWRIAALDATTGALVTSFLPRPDAKVRTIVATSDTVYFGGLFSHVGNQVRSRLAAASAADGSLRPWAPAAEGASGVNAIVISPDGSKLVVGGSFTSLNGSTNPGYGLGAVSADTGALLPFNVNGLIRNGGSQAAITGLSADADTVYGTGYVFGSGGNLEGTFAADWSDGTMKWVEDCHGDTYASFPMGELVYQASHKHFCGTIGGFPQTDPWTMYLGTAVTKAATQTVTANPYGGYYNFEGNPAPTMVNWYPQMDRGTYTGQNQGPWTVTGNSQYVLMGGEFRNVSGRAQQGLVRFAVPELAPNKVGPSLTGGKIDLSAVSLSRGTARVRWTANFDYDNTELTYTLIRNSNAAAPVMETTLDSTFFQRPGMGFLDEGLTPGADYRYRLRVTDPWGNSVLSDTVYITASDAAPTESDYAEHVLADDPSYYWRLGEPDGSTAVDEAGWEDAVVGSGVTRGATGAVLGDPNTASTFNGTADGIVVTRNAEPGADQFTAEAWVKTTSNRGGKILGFGNAATGSSSSYDRHVYMDNAGHIWFGVYPGSVKTVNSGETYNDGEWHHIVASLGSSGMQLFVDGLRVGARADVTTGQQYSGYWRVGGDNLNGWTNRPSSDFLAGSVDEVAIYPTALRYAQVVDHYVSSGRTLDLPPRPADEYGAAVYDGEPELYWRLNETSGTVAADAGLTGTTGTFRGGVTLGAEGLRADGTAVTFDGAGGLLSSDRSFSDPEVYSTELWFTTTTTAGGKLIGFGDNPAGLSSNYDRHVYMEADGRLTFGVWTGQANTITSAQSYNDGQWHQMVATQSGAGMVLYVDGVAVGSNPQTGAQDYTGYWKVGGDTTWGPQPYFAGTIDEVAVYSTALSPATVDAHYRLGTGAPEPENQAPVAQFTATPTDLAVAFDGSASTDPDGTVASYAWDFGDGAVASGATTSHTYAAAGTYDVALTVTDDEGLSTTTTQSVTVTEPPNQAPVASFTTVVTDLSVAVDGSGSSDPDGVIESFAWDFGDGSTASGAGTSHTYAVAGTYTVTLTVTDDDGGTASSSQFVVVAAAPVNQAPVASFTATVTNLSVAVDGSASTDPDGVVAAYAWDFGDGSTGAGMNAAHGYAAAGTYTVTLTVTDDDGATASTSQPVVVDSVEPPSGVLAADAFDRAVTGGWATADTGGPWSYLGSTSLFSVTDGRGRLTVPRAGGGLTALLTGVSATDTDVSLSVAPTQRVDGGGSFISLIARRIGPSDYRAKIKVASNGAVTLYLNRSSGAENTLAAAVVPGVSFAAGDQLQMRLSVTGTSPTTLKAKVWEVGQAEPADWQLTATDSTPVLQAAGGVGVMVYVSGSATQVPMTFTVDDLSATAPGAVVEPPNQAPQAAFTTAASGLGIAVDASGSTDPDGVVASYAWDFGDGQSATGASAAHTYAAGGTYTVTLTVTDDDGATASSSQDVSVTDAPPPANIAPVAQFGAAADGLTVAFDGTSSTDTDGTVVGYAWDFGDGHHASEAAPSHTYAAAGTYAVSLTVTDDDGATGVASQEITVTAPEPPADGVVIADAFERAVTGGWGTADVGGAWSLVGQASTFSVAAGAGQMSLPRAGAGLTAVLAGVAVTDATATVRATTDPVANGGGAFVSVIGRRVGTADYRAKVKLAANGAATLYLTRVDGAETNLAVAGVPGLSLASGESLRISLDVTGTAPTTLRAKVWKDGQPEPADWLLTATDSTASLQSAGAVGLVAYLSGSATNAPLAVRFDDFVVTQD